MIASYITTFFISAFEEPTYYHPFYSNPFDVAQDLVTAAFRVMKDGDLASIIEDNIRQPSTARPGVPVVPRPRPGMVIRFIQRFIIGLPLVGAGSLVHLLLSVQFLAPVQWLARYRGRRTRQNNGSRDVAALIVISLLVVGALRHVLSSSLLQIVLEDADTVAEHCIKSIDLPNLLQGGSLHELKTPFWKSTEDVLVALFSYHILLCLITRSESIKIWER